MCIEDTTNSNIGICKGTVPWPPYITTLSQNDLNEPSTIFSSPQLAVCYDYEQVDRTMSLVTV